MPAHRQHAPETAVGIFATFQAKAVARQPPVRDALGHLDIALVQHDVRLGAAALALNIEHALGATHAEHGRRHLETVVIRLAQLGHGEAHPATDLVDRRGDDAVILAHAVFVDTQGTVGAHGEAGTIVHIDLRRGIVAGTHDITGHQVHPRLGGQHLIAAQQFGLAGNLGDHTHLAIRQGQARMPSQQHQHRIYEPAHHVPLLSRMCPVL